MTITIPVTRTITMTIVTMIIIIPRNTYLAITLAKLGLVTAPKLSPVGRLKELDG